LLPVSILHTERALLVVNKPPGLLTQGDFSGDPNLLDILREILRKETGRANPFLALVHRLDRPASGVMVFARTSKSASRLSQAFRDHRVEKFYLAWVSPPPRREEGLLLHLLKRERGSDRTLALPFEEGSSLPFGALLYRTLRVEGRRAFLLIRLLTGRKHQIRAQLSAIGSPVVGDKRYGSSAGGPPGMIFLHALRLTFPHPITRTPLTFTAPPPETFPDPGTIEERLFEELLQREIALPLRQAQPGRW
jgi:23S rRNA pseudouridine1911/1915/1917 synthase